MPEDGGLRRAPQDLHRQDPEARPARPGQGALISAAHACDSTVIFDVGESDPVWRAWSEEAIRRCLDEGLLVINPIIYAEVSVGYRTVEEVEAVLPADLYRREPLPYDAAFLAGKAFVAYRRRGGRRTAPLPDFYIGAHAAVSGYRLLTRDVQRFRTYFPTLALVTP